MSDNTLRSRDPQIRAYTDRNDSGRISRLPTREFMQEVRELRTQYQSLSPEQQRTMRYNTAENMRRTASDRGDARTLYYLDQGFFPGGGLGMPPRHIDTSNFATPAQNRALQAGAPSNR